MVNSLFPRSLPTFTDHKNFLDVVEAEHLNYVQRELRATTQTIGINPQTYAKPYGYGRAPAATVTVDYGTVAARLDAQEARTTTTMWSSAVQANKSYPGSNLDGGTIGTLPANTMPLHAYDNPYAVNWDPDKMTVENGAVVNEPGFYQVSWQITAYYAGGAYSTKIGAQAPIAYAALVLGGTNSVANWLPTTTLKNMAVEGTSIPPQYAILHRSDLVYCSRGTALYLNLGHNLSSLFVSTATLSGFLVRGTS